MRASYDPGFVALSVVIAVLASLAALNLAGRVRSDTGATRPWWIIGGACVMGLGIWSMHFVGMLAFHLPTPIWYDVPLMLLSVVVAIAASFLAFVVVNRAKLGAATLIPGGILMGLAIAGMHYTGMASLRTEAHTTYSPVLVVLSVLIAIVASLAALWLAFRFRFIVSPRGTLLKAMSAVVMGGAIAGMHYTAMAAVRFAPRDAMEPSALLISASGGLGGAIVVSTITIVLLALIGAVVDRDIQARLAFARELSERALQLGKSEQQFRLIVDTALDGVVTMNSAGLITDWNAQAEKMFGWSREEAVGQRMSSLIIPAGYRDAHERGLARFLATGEGPVLNRRIEITALRRSGVEFPVELAISPARVEAEWTFSAFIRDLTERNKAAEALRLEEQRYRELFEDVPVGLYRSSPDGRLIDVNPAMVAMLGYPDRQTLLDTPATELYVSADDRARWAEDFTRAGHVRDFTVRMRRADGAMIWIRENTHAKRDAGGTVVLCEGSLEDITESIEAERRLQASEQRLAQILETVPIGIYVCGKDGRVQFANAAAKRLLGREIDPDAVAEEHSTAYQAYVAGTDRLYPTGDLPLIRALKGQRSSTDDIEIRQGERIVSLSVHGAPILDHEGNVVAAVAAFMDTSDRKILEAQLRQALKMEAVGQLAGGVAHDFNNLLTVILSYGSMLMERLDPADPVREDVGEMTAAADRAAGLTRQLLAFSRKQVMQPQVIDLNSVIRNVESLLRRLIGEDIELVIDLQQDIAAINADPGQLEQVLMNLAVNARDAMPDGGVLTISTADVTSLGPSSAAAARASDGKYVVLSVTDTGSGMTHEVRHRLFDPFFTTKAPGSGTGLGLSTVYGIVKQSGGDIHVRSEPGRGTVFEVYLPHAEAQPDRAATDGAVHAASRGSETILLVEDDPNLRTLAVRVLKKYGYTVIAAEHGTEALVLAADPRTVIDAVLTDVIMPGINGREVVERLLEIRPGLPYLFMSGYTDDDVLRRGVLHGESAFLQKPFTPDQLARAIREVLERGGRERATRDDATRT